MSFSAQIIDQHVGGLVERLGERLRTEVGVRDESARLKSAAFVVLVAQALLDLDDDAALDGVVEGGGDFGIDALYVGALDEVEIPIVLIQGKYRQDLKGDAQFPESGIEKMITALGTLFDPNRAYRVNPRLESRVEEIRAMIGEGAIPRVRVVLCNNGLKWNQAGQLRLENTGFHDMVGWEYAGPDDLIALMRRRKDVETQIRLTGRAVVEDYDFMRAMVGRLSVLELARLFETHGDALLERNIRRYLGLGGRINERIAQTLRDPAQRDKFYFYNNGITIVCSKFSYNGLAERDWIVRVNGLQIVNGGQTSKTIQQVKAEVGDDIGTACVLVRLYEVPGNDDDLVQRITEATNSQNPVDLRDLRSNDPRQKDLADALALLGFTYRAQRSRVPVEAGEITSAVAAEAVLAVWRHRPHAARFQVKEHFGSYYDLIFSPDLNGAQVVMAVLLLRWAENKRKRPPADAPVFLQYGSRHVAMLMGMALLDDLGEPLAGLTHRTLAKARALLETRADLYFNNALARLQGALTLLYGDAEPSLQRLSATFRRADLVAVLRGGRQLSV
ncbi:AIPR family protein [Pararhodospirillum oryzae]|uniref:Abortive phage infection protein C-terminal domain-containing protein n=1 Tax=Pararhodospirillum oryzae TaxID=478448 RepID=A0A512HAJ5_9PROT|nr:AIPR family protein [Pararhodospirillum oryzae]GEO82458.1 hypothetical protein ROR02_25890 [Pararhodospirillum oryzae]